MKISPDSPTPTYNCMFAGSTLAERGAQHRYNSEIQKISNWEGGREGAGEDEAHLGFIRKMCGDLLQRPS